ncbi:hypothetical protein [Ramlibacter albus]|uniref:Uncharacterized protein n=1 Tax=Ramlibacter albus TaxID=2079448 RepID=A0A923MC28_9BURK|nr:hypothetical protein [Ramlibacter albus]MBC5767925.1 hypothetical protein [Ramlibacter albus]
MFKRAAAALLATAALVPAFGAPANTFDRDMNTMWEVLWHQSGTATRLVRWEKDLQVRVIGPNAPAHREHSLEAIRAVAAEAGVKVNDVTDRADAAEVANVTFEVVPNDKLSPMQPCQTGLNFFTEKAIESALVQMRDSDAQRCAFHEAMHVMGVRGHPEGETVLSYFTAHSHSLLPLDKAMLRAWYSPKAKGGMTPFEMLPILADQLVSVSKNKAAASVQRDRFLARTVQEMEAFADGRGDVPAILKRSGKVTDSGIKFGRVEMSYFLGVAYQEGACVQRSEAQATRWLQVAGNMGSRSAQARLAGASGS